jgi:hypothetical protein
MVNNSSIHEAVSHEKQAIAHLAKKFQILYKTEMSIAMFKGVNSRPLCGTLFRVMKSEELAHFNWKILHTLCILFFGTYVSNMPFEI